MSDKILQDKINIIYTQYNDNLIKIDKYYIDALYRLLNLKFILDEKSIIDKQILDLKKKNHNVNIKNNEKLLDILLENMITQSYQP